MDGIISLDSLTTLIEKADLEAAAQQKVVDDLNEEVQTCEKGPLQLLKIKALRTAELKTKVRLEEAAALREEKMRLVEEQRQALEEVEELKNPGTMAAKMRRKSAQQARERGAVDAQILDAINIEDFTCSVNSRPDMNLLSELVPEIEPKAELLRSV